MPRRFDPRRHVEYYPHEFTPGSKEFAPEDYDGDEFPVALTDEMILRAHYLDLGLSHLLQKYREGTLSDQEYIQYHRMNGELRGLLKHIWSIGKRALELWVTGHLMGGNPAYKIGITNVEQLIDTLKDLGLPADPAIEIMEDALGYDFGDDIKLQSIGAPPLYGEQEYEDPEERERFEEALRRAGVSDLDDVEPSNDEKWWFLKDQLELWDDPQTRPSYGTSPSPLREREVAYFGTDIKNPYTFMYGESEDEDGVYRGFTDASGEIGKSHVEPYAEMRLHPDYRSHIDDLMAGRWDPINNMRAHRGLLSEIGIGEEEWESLDTQSQMALISRLLQAQHRTGNIITDNTPDLRFTSGRYVDEDRPRWRNEPSSKTEALREVLDDLNRSSMVDSWDRMMTEHPHERWSGIGRRMTRLASRLDEKGHHRLADDLDKVAGYSSELGMLRQILKEGYNPYDYDQNLNEFLEDEGIDIAEGKGANWIEGASQDELESFEDWNQDHPLSESDPYYAPAYESMDYEGTGSPKWQVHFTDDPYGIASSGFEYGHPEIDGIALTTWKKDRKKRGGFNFSFDADSVPNQTSYGKNAVIFPTGAINVFHHGDQEHQNIFWGPTTDPLMIFPVMNEGEDWVIYDWNDREVFRSGSLRDCVGWVERNWRQLLSTREKIDPNSRRRRRR